MIFDRRSLNCGGFFLKYGCHSACFPAGICPSVPCAAAAAKPGLKFSILRLTTRILSGNIFFALNNSAVRWGYSSAGRALEWHSRGQRFDPAYLHHRMRWVFLDNLSYFKASFFFCLFPAGNGLLFLCGDFHNVQPQAKLCKVNVEINVQLVVPIDLHPTDQAVDDHFLCLQAGRVI